MNKNGFTLMQTLVSLVILGVLLVVFASFSQNVVNLFSSINKSKSIMGSMEEIRFTLAVNRQCKANFNNKVLSQQISDVSSYDKDGVLAGPILKIGQKLQGLVVTGMSFKNSITLNSSLVQSDLVVTFQDYSKPLEPPLERSLPLLFQVNAGVILNCWLNKDRSEMEMSQVCLGITNGALNSYDAVAKKCTLNHGQWFSGTMTQASCPAGSYLPAKANVDYNCGFQPTQLNSSPLVEAKFTMTDGSFYSTGQPPALTTLTAGICTCDWATDIAATDLANAKCMIYCVVPQ